LALKVSIELLAAREGYAVREVFGWKCSLDAKPGRAKEFYLVPGAAKRAIEGDRYHAGLHM
jgi:hypothetical protein